MLADIPYIEVVGTAINGQIALMKIPSLKPDALILDVEMPELDGIETLKALKKYHPSIKIIMLSIHTTRGADKTLEALSLGAIDFVEKPSGSNDYTAHFQQIRNDLLPKLWLLKLQKSSHMPETQLLPPKHLPRVPRKECDIIAIASSTGGPNALTTILPKIRANVNVSILIVQHMPPLFTKQFALSLDQKTAYTVREASAGDVITPNLVFIAPGNYHMAVRKVGAGERRISLHQGPPENGCRPSANVLFRSVAEIYGKRALGVVLTGMGNDGTDGIKSMKNQGATILSQDKDSSVAWGMPRSVIEAELADIVLPLHDIAQTINAMISG